MRQLKFNNKIFTIAILTAFLFIFQNCSSGDVSENNPTVEDNTTPAVVDLSADNARYVDGSGNIDDYEVKRGWCESRGWTKLIVDTDVGNTVIRRKVLHKGPTNAWSGTILVFHGGGGNYTNWCTTNLTAWGAFTTSAIARGYGVILMDATDITKDANNNLCGKIWDDNILSRDNHDLPYIEEVITAVTPSLRPAGSSDKIFLVGFSSGGFMTTRAATHFNQLITKFAPVGSGSPYGWHRDCSALNPDRPTVAGEGLDNDTNLAIPSVGSCGPYFPDNSTTYPGELSWDDGGATVKPKFLKLEHFYDGINDYSCHSRIYNRLLFNGYIGNQFVLSPAGLNRSPIYHDWFPEFSSAILNFFDEP